MKKALSLILLLALCLSLCACGEDDASIDSTQKEMIRKYKKYETLITFLEGKDYESAYDEIVKIALEDSGSNNGANNDGNQNPSQPPKTETIELTLENWKEFFELTVDEEYRVNQFGDVETLVLSQYLVLKDEYVGRVTFDDVAVEMKRTAQRINIKISSDEKAYTLGDVVEERELTPSPDIKSLHKSEKYGYYIDVFSNNYINAKDNANSDSGSSKTVWLVESMDCLEATRIKGTITIEIQ